MPITRLQRPPLHAAAVGSLLLSGLAHGQAADLPRAPDLAALVQCQASVEQFAGLTGAVDDPLQAVALGWAPQPRTNPFMAEYRLNTPVQAHGQRSDWLAISGGTVMLVLDQAQVSPQALAAQLALEVVVDESGKFMAGRELVSRDWIDPENGQTLIESAVIGVSTVASHAGKTLVGCTYSLDLPEEQPDSDPQPSDG